MPMHARNPTRLAAIDFSREIERLTEGFTGRGWVFEEVDKWVRRGNGRFFILTGEPGVGKSAIAARLTQVRDDVIAHHFCIAGRTGTVRPATALRSLAAQLGDNLPGYGKALAGTVSPIHLSVNVEINAETMTAGKITGVVIEHLYASDPEEELGILLRAPLSELPVPPAPVLILLDSLDEAATYRGDVNLVTLLAGVDDLPPWVRFICTTRPEQRVLRYFDGAAPYVLAAESQMNLDDIRQYVLNRAGGEKMRACLREAEAEPQALADLVTGLSDGNFLYIKILLNDVETGQQSLKDLDILPQSLDEIYHGFLNRFAVSEWEERYQPILGVLAVAQEPLTEDQVAGFAGIRRTRVRQYLGVAVQFLDQDEDEHGSRTYALFHQSLRDYLLDEERNKDYWCAPEDQHRSIIDHYLENDRRRWSGCDRYGLRHLPVHLAAAGQAQDLRELLLDFDWLQAKLDATDAGALIADYDLLAHDPDVRLVQEAVRLSTHVLAQDTAQLAGQLLGRLASFERAGLHPLLEGAMRWRGAPWLRPLTPSLTHAGGPLLRTLVHNGAVRAVAVLPDGQRVVSGSRDGALKVWDLESGEEDSSLAGHRFGVEAVAAMPYGQRVVSAAGDSLKVWDVGQGEEAATLQTRSNVQAAAILPDGQRIIFGLGSGALGVWDLERGREDDLLEGHAGEVLAVAALPDGRRAVSASRDGTLKVWDLGQRVALHTLVGHADEVMCVAVTPDGRRAVSGSKNGTLKVWDLERGEEVGALAGHRGWIWAVVALPDGRRAISASGDTLKVWDLDSGAELGTLWHQSGSVEGLAVTPDGRRAVSASYDGTLKVWDLERIEETGSTRTRHSQEVEVVAVAPGGRWAVSGSRDHTLKVWDVERKDVRHTLSGHTGWIRAVAMLPDGRRAISASNDGTLKVWDLERGEEEITLAGHMADVMAVAVLPDGRRAVSVSYDSTVKVWNLERWEEERTLPAPDHQGWIWAVAALPDGRRVISASDDCTLKIWELQHGQELRTLAGHPEPVHAVAVLPDGRRAISGSRDHTLKVWDLERCQEEGTLKGHTNAVMAVAAFPDGRHAVSASADGSLKVWDLESGTAIASFVSGEGYLLACAAAPDGRTIVAGDTSGRVHFLQLER
jgi:WD40 repeat protein